MSSIAVKNRHIPAFNPQTREVRTDQRSQTLQDLRFSFHRRAPVQIKNGFLRPDQLDSYLENHTAALQTEGLPLRLLSKGRQTLIMATQSFEIQNEHARTNFLTLVGLADRILEFRSSHWLETAPNTQHRELNDGLTSVKVALADFIVRQSVECFEQLNANPEDFRFRYGPGKYMRLVDVLAGEGVLFLNNQPIHLSHLRDLVFKRLENSDSSWREFKELLKYDLNDARLDPVSVRAGFMGTTFLTTAVITPLKPIALLFLSLQMFKGAYRKHCLDKLQVAGEQSDIRKLYLNGIRALLMPFNQGQVIQMAESLNYQATESRARIVYASCDGPLGMCLLGELKDRFDWQCVC